MPQVNSSFLNCWCFNITHENKCYIASSLASNVAFRPPTCKSLGKMRNTDSRSVSLLYWIIISGTGNRLFMLFKKPCYSVHSKGLFLCTVKVKGGCPLFMAISLLALVSVKHNISLLDLPVWDKKMAWFQSMILKLCVYVLLCNLRTWVHSADFKMTEIMPYP